MSTNDPDAIRADIEQTRTRLSDDVNALSDAANPKNVAQDQVNKVKGAVGEKVTEVKETLFGSPDHPYDEGRVGDIRSQASDKVDDAKATLAQAGDQAKAAVQDAPRQVKRQTAGRPLAAGLIAFGFGALLGSLMPATRAEQDAAAQLKSKAQPMVDQAKDAAKDAVQQLKEPAQQAAQELKEHVGQSAEAVKSHASDEAEGVKQEAETSRQVVAGQASAATEEVKQAAQSDQSQF